MEEAKRKEKDGSNFVSSPSSPPFLFLSPLGACQMVSTVRKEAKSAWVSPLLPAEEKRGTYLFLPQNTVAKKEIEIDSSSSVASAAGDAKYSPALLGFFCANRATLARR